MNSQPTTQTAADEDTIRAIHRRMIDAWNAGDSTAFAAPFTDRADFVAWDGTHLNLHHFRDGANDDPSLSVRVLIAAGQTKMQRSAYGLIGLLTLTAIPLSAGGAPAQTDRQATSSHRWTRSGLNGGISPIRARFSPHNASVPETDASSLARS